MLPGWMPVDMANGGKKPIAEVKKGEKIIGLFRYANEVLKVERVRYKARFGNGLITRGLFQIGPELIVSGTHPVWTGQQWALVERDVYETFVVRNNATGIGALDLSKVVPFGPTLPIPIEIDGQQVVPPVYDVTLAVPVDEWLYALKTDGSKSMRSCGIYVSAHADDGFDYEVGNPRG